jgi:hypothetical protein
MDTLFLSLPDKLISLFEGISLGGHRIANLDHIMQSYFGCKMLGRSVILQCNPSQTHTISLRERRILTVRYLFSVSAQYRHKKESYPETQTKVSLGAKTMVYPGGPDYGIPGGPDYGIPGGPDYGIPGGPD